MVVSAKTFEQVALEDGDHQWELDRGVLRAKPPMSMQHNRTSFELGFQIRNHPQPERFSIRVNGGHVSLGDDSYYIPDVSVIPTELEERYEGVANRLETYGEPLPFVAEIWSPSTGSYDVNKKLRRYIERGDAEVWLVHPFERRVRAWIRRAGGGYDVQTYETGAIALSAVPGVSIDLDRLFNPGRRSGST